jgi:hypothetical protein
VDLLEIILQGDHLVVKDGLGVFVYFVLLGFFVFGCLWLWILVMICRLYVVVVGLLRQGFKLDLCDIFIWVFME